MKILQTAKCRNLVLTIFVCLFALACGVANVPPTMQTTFATVQPTANVVCTALRGAVTIRNANGRAVAWLSANAPVCVIPGVTQGRVWLADGSGTILAACVFGPQKDCK